MGPTTLLAVAAAAALAPTALAQYFYVPNALANAPGNDSLPILGDTPCTYQMVIDAVELSGIAPGEQIIAFSWRAAITPSNPASWPATNAFFPSFDLRLAPAATSANTVSTIFADNIGPGEVTVRSGPLTIPAATFTQGTLPNPSAWGFEIPFLTPYTYTGGNLVFTLRQTGSIGMGSLLCDGDTTPPPPNRRHAGIYAGVAVAVAGGVGAAVALGGKKVVPAPSSLVILGAGALIASRRRRDTVPS